MKLLTYCNKLDRELPYLLKSVDGKIPYECHIVSGEWDWRNVVKWQYDMAKRFPEETLVIVDAYDCLFVGDVKELEYAIGGKQLVFCADKRCWPNAAVEFRYPKSYSRWRFLNGSTLVGKGRSIADALEWGFTYAPIQPPKDNGLPILFQDNDQRFWTDIFLAGYGEIDEYCEIFQNLSAIKDEEFGVIQGRFRNIVTGTSPQFIHAAAKTWWLIPKELYEDR